MVPSAMDLDRSWLPCLSMVSCRRFLLLGASLSLTLFSLRGLGVVRYFASTIELQQAPPAWTGLVPATTPGPPPPSPRASSAAGPSPQTSETRQKPPRTPRLTAASTTSAAHTPRVSLRTTPPRTAPPRTTSAPKHSPSPSLKTQSSGKSQSRPSALCIVGNIRTFPYTFSSLEGFAVDNALHTYLVLQLGSRTGSTWLRYHSDYLGPAAEERLVQELQRRAKQPAAEGQMDVRRVAVVRTGTCSEYNRDFAPQEKYFSRLCRETATHAQLRWVRTCFSMVLASKIRYERVVRTRPDVGIFGHIALSRYHASGRSYGMYALWKPGCPEVAGDWFYFLDGSSLLSWWRRVEEEATRSYQQWPYLDYFQFKRLGTKCLHFPAVIVRGDHFAECCRFAPDRGSGYAGLAEAPDVGRRMERACQDALRSNTFARPASFLMGLVGEGRGALRFCNEDRGPR
mmetsp:Transcript_12414/g.34174  ORF Transcript_12414/g.34174 Transcript_12414/m.34174 type:complete len:456 (-) Transcript_12414:11-1378(-)